MNAEVNRRGFVALVAAGLPVVAGAAYGLAAASPAEHGHGGSIGGDGGDPVFEHVLREVAAIHNRGQRRGFTGEDARAIAAQLRTAAVRGTQTGIDATATKGLQRLIRSRGREAVLRIETDGAKVRSALQRYGIEVDSRRFAVSAGSAEIRAKALETLISGGVTGVLSDTAVTLEKISATLDQADHRVARVRRVQSDPSFFSSFCWQLLLEIQIVGAQAAPLCEASAYYPDLEIACASIQATLSVMYSMYWAYCG